ncbi:mechanosensitive ion channel family protein [Azonexus sp. IMCC34839]|uniref:mechanosensitive ion channel family protein n=1 Tax=Azonexus sp. IMCC34839 TaxID=3133695 RepID=UPI0039999650
MDSSLNSIDQVRASAIDMAIRFGPKLVVAIAILVAGYIVGRWAARLLERLLSRFKLDSPVVSLLRKIVQLLVLGLFAIMALQNLGIELLPLIAGLSVAGAGVALAMQGILGNIVAGLTIIFTRPFHVGDYISIVEEEGEVLDISLFSTTLGHADKSKVVIPNRKIVGEILHNYGQIRQLRISVTLSYAADVDQALGLVEEILQQNSRVLREPEPVFGIARLTDAGVVIGVGPWVAVVDHDAAVGEINKRLLEVFAAQNIALSVPLREIRMLGAAA